MNIYRHNMFTLRCVSCIHKIWVKEEISPPQPGSDYKLNRLGLILFRYYSM